mgnify:CR=1 FL=1
MTIAPLHLNRKTHLFDEEKRLFDPGDTGFQVWKLPGSGVAVGLMICFDWIFPEAARSLDRPEAAAQVGRACLEVMKR